MNDKKLQLLKKRVEKKRLAQKKLEELAESVEKLVDRPVDVHIPEIEVPKADIVTEMDTTGLEAIAEETKLELALIKDKLDQPSNKALNEVKDAFKTLQNTFKEVIKAAQDDIYARYAFSNSGEDLGGQYVGYVNGNGDWFIQKFGKDIVGNQSSTFAVGKKGTYKTAWDNKIKLTYKLRSEVYIP